MSLGTRLPLAILFAFSVPCLPGATFYSTSPSSDSAFSFMAVRASDQFPRRTSTVGVTVNVSTGSSTTAVSPLITFIRGGLQNSAVEGLGIPIAPRRSAV